MYPFWEDVIVEFEEEGKNELILTGGLGTGKSYLSLVIFLRKIYVLSCYSSLSNYLSLAQSSLILFVYLAISVKQAILTGFGKFIRLLDSIPYFNDHYPRNKRLNSVVDFLSKEVTVISGSNIGHYRGGDLFGIILDESNFRTGTDKTKLVSAQEIYKESTHRRKTRFASFSNDLSFSIIASSASTQTAFTEERIKSASSDSSVMVVRATTWQVKPHRYKGDFFWIFKGTEKLDPFIEYNSNALSNYFKVMSIKPSEIKELPPSSRSDWVQIPVEFRSQFEDDGADPSKIVSALADLAGIATGSISRILSDELSFAACFSKTGDFSHPFTKERFVVSYKTLTRVEDFLFEGIKFDKTKEYFAHIDQSLTEDSTGVAIATKGIDKKGSYIEVPLMVKIDPPQRPDQISVRKVREFLLYLRDERSLNLKLLTYDGFGSAESLQEASNKGVETEHLSVDRDSSQYDLVVDLILRRRIKSYFYQPLKEELFSLEKDRVKNKVDHVSGGAKDISDALAGSVWNAWVHGKTPFAWSKFVGK